MIYPKDAGSPPGLNKLATISNDLARSPSTGQVVDLEGVVTAITAGGCTGGADCVTIQYAGDVSCVFDGATTKDDIVVHSPTVGKEGQCHDAGVYKIGSSSANNYLLGETIGQVDSTNVGAGTYLVHLVAPSILDGAFSAGNQFNSASTYYNIPFLISQSGRLGFSGMRYGHADNDRWSFQNVGTNAFPDDLHSQVTIEMPGANTTNLLVLRALSGQHGEDQRMIKLLDETNGLVEWTTNTFYDTRFGWTVNGAGAGGAYVPGISYNFQSPGNDFLLQKPASGANVLATVATTDKWGILGQLGSNFSGQLFGFGRAVTKLDNNATAGDYLIPSVGAGGQAHSVGTSWPFVGQIIGRPTVNQGGTGNTSTWLEGAEIRGGPFGIGLLNQSLSVTTGPTTLVAANVLPADAQIEICVQQITTTGVAATTSATTATYNDENNLAQTDTVAASLATTVQGNHNGGCITPWIKANAAVTLTTTIVGAPVVSIRSRAIYLGALN
jgi:hypothetical protein